MGVFAVSDLYSLGHIETGDLIMTPGEIQLRKALVLLRSAKEELDLLIDETGEDEVRQELRRDRLRLQAVIDKIVTIQVDES